jgi:hypothetical protein
MMNEHHEIEKHVRETTFRDLQRIKVETSTETVNLLDEFNPKLDKDLVATQDRILNNGLGSASQVQTTGFGDWIRQVRQLQVKMELLMTQSPEYVWQRSAVQSSDEEESSEESSEVDESSEVEQLPEPILVHNSSSDDEEPLPEKLSKA